MRWVAIGTVLLAILFHIFYKDFDIPLKLPFNPLKIVGGFPTLIDQFYENPSNSTDDIVLDSLPPEVFSSRRIQNSKLTCEILETSTSCLSLLTSPKCLSNSQYSYNFYNSTSCYYSVSKNISSCRDPILIGNICQNIVTHVHGTVAELSNVPLNSQVLQSYSNPLESSERCQNYSTNDVIRTSNGHFEKFQNSTVILDICPDEEDLEYCNNCASNCDVPLIFLTNVSCFGGDVEISISHINGFIYSAVIEQISGNQTIWKKSVYFYEREPGDEKSRFDLRRGRFHCPSERTCPLEIFYPLQYLSSLDFYPAQITVLIFSILISILILRKQ